MHALALLALLNAACSNADRLAEAASTAFRAHPDGWKAFWARYPGSTGVIELSPVRLTDDSAALVVGRSCGEHCRTAWRVRLGRAGAGWRVARVEFLPVPHT